MGFVEIHGQLEIFLAFTVDFSKLRFFLFQFMSIKRTLLFVVFALSILLFWSIFWLRQHFGALSLEQMLFHLHFPILNVGNTLITDFCRFALLPAALVIALVFFADKILHFANKIPFPFPLVQRFFYVLAAAAILGFFRIYVYFSPIEVLAAVVIAFFLKELSQWRFFKTAHTLAIFFAILYCAFWAENFLNIRQFVADYQNTSTFYEKHYVNFTPPPRFRKC